MLQNKTNKQQPKKTFPPKSQIEDVVFVGILRPLCDLSLMGKGFISHASTGHCWEIVLSFLGFKYTGWLNLGLILLPFEALMNVDFSPSHWGTKNQLLSLPTFIFTQEIPQREHSPSL